MQNFCDKQSNSFQNPYSQFLQSTPQANQQFLPINVIGQYHYQEKAIQSGTNQKNILYQPPQIIPFCDRYNRQSMDRPFTNDKGYNAPEIMDRPIPYFYEDQYRSKPFLDQDVYQIPYNATRILKINGIPIDCQLREVQHVFRPFIGYREVKLIKKRSKFNDDEIFLCFVNFDDEITAAVCLQTLQGYRFDPDDSNGLKIEFGNEQRNEQSKQKFDKNKYYYKSKRFQQIYY